MIYHFYVIEKNLIKQKKYSVHQIIEKTVFHISTLKQALNHGLKLTKVHKVMEFTENDWLKQYIMMNTENRMNAKNDFEKDFFKGTLMQI